MRPVRLGPVPPDPAGKLDWCVKALQEIALASRDADPNSYADSFVFTNVTDDRTLNCDSTTLAELADVVATFIQDHKSRGQKRT